VINHIFQELTRKETEFDDKYDTLEFKNRYVVDDGRAYENVDIRYSIQTNDWMVPKNNKIGIEDSFLLNNDVFDAIMNKIDNIDMKEVSVYLQGIYREFKDTIEKFEDLQIIARMGGYDNNGND
jgi:hypothetical protein